MDSSSSSSSASLSTRGYWNRAAATTIVAANSSGRGRWRRGQARQKIYVFMLDNHSFVYLCIFIMDAASIRLLISYSTRFLNAEENLTRAEFPSFNITMMRNRRIRVCVFSEHEMAKSMSQIRNNESSLMFCCHNH